MSEPAESEETLTITGIGINMRPMEGDLRVLRNILLGNDPMILIEFEQTPPNGDTKVNIDATGFDNREGIVDMLEGLAELIRDATLSEAEWHDAEGNTVPIDIVDRQGL